VISAGSGAGGGGTPGCEAGGGSTGPDGKSPPDQSKRMSNIPAIPVLSDFSVYAAGEGCTQLRHRGVPHIETVIHDHWHAAKQEGRSPRCRWCRQVILALYRATAFRSHWKLQAVLSYRQGIDRNLSDFTMDLKLESILQQRLHHGAEHHCLTWSWTCIALRLCSIV
jgi:hypothetical protein